MDAEDDASRASTYGRFKILREIDLFQLWIQCPKNGAGRLVGRLVLKVDFKRLLLAVPFSPLDNSNTWPQTVFMIQTDDQGAFIRIELDEAPERVDAQGLDGDFHQRLLVPAFRSKHEELPNCIVRQQGRTAMSRAD